MALGAGRFTDAVARARAVLEHGERVGAAEEVCDALLVLGRVARRDDLGAAEKLAERARHVAEEAGLAVPDGPTGHWSRPTTPARSTIWIARWRRSRCARTR